jgi:hypothetical protein
VAVAITTIIHQVLSHFNGMKIITNFVKPRIQNELEALFTHGNFPYFYNQASCVPADYRQDANEDPRITGEVLTTENTVESPQFSHTLFSSGAINSDSYNNVTPILNKLIDIVDGDYFLARCKVNLNVSNPSLAGKHRTPHIDNGFDDQLTAIYYVNDSDGDTLFFDRQGHITQRVKPEKGKLIWWSGKVFHAKEYSTESKTRIILNINLLPYGN